MNGFDFYRKLLAKAAWGWRECKVYHRWHKRLTKDRASGRAEKRKAKQLERADRDA